MMTEEFRHYTVLLKETVDGLQVKPDGVRRLHTRWCRT